MGTVTWTSVEDGLPPEYSFVIVYFADRGTVMNCYFYKDFTLVRCSAESGFEPHGVTHWALIEPPINSAMR